MKRHVEWIPSSRFGSSWLANCEGVRRGYVRKLKDGNFEVTIYGRRSAYCHDMRFAAKQLVAYVNHVRPSSL